MSESSRKRKGDDDMAKTFKMKPIKSTEIDFKTDESYENFINIVKEPQTPSDFVKDLVKNYKKEQSER